MRVASHPASLSPCHPVIPLLLLVCLVLITCRQPEGLIPDTAVDRVKVQVVQDGFYRVSLAELRAPGLPATYLSSSNVHLSQANTAVPFLVDGDALVFYGQAPADPYTASRTYIVKVGQAGLAMRRAAVAGHATAPRLEHIAIVRHLEENHIYEARARDGEESDLWFWQTLGHRQTVTLAIDLPVVANGLAVLELNLWGFTKDSQVDNDHDFDLIVNGRYQDTIRWDGAAHHTSHTELSPGSLQNGANIIVLDNAVEGAAALDVMQFNWARLIYAAPPVAINQQLHFFSTGETLSLSGFSERPLIFDVGHPESPVMLTGWTFDEHEAHLATGGDASIAAIGPGGYLTPLAVEPVRHSRWRRPENQADLLIITTDALAPALAPLATARQEQGLRVAIIPVAEIYDAFGFGQATPESIRAFIAYAAGRWQEPRPRYVLLVGDATSDYRNYLGRLPHNHVPSPMVPVLYGGETVSDARLVDLDGDARPDLAIGRWPVASVNEVESLVARTLAYDQAVAAGPALFVADASEPYFDNMAGRLWQEGGFSEQQRQHLSGGTARQLTAAWNERPWLATYVGHGSLGQWGKDNLFSRDTLVGLAAAPAIVLHFTCLTGLFAHPEQISLAEAMLAHNHGPVLVVAATSLTLSLHQEPFAVTLLQKLNDPAITRIGDAFYQAKLALDVGDHQALREVSDTFVLIGDPSAPIIRPITRRSSSLP